MLRTIPTLLAVLIVTLGSSQRLSKIPEEFGSGSIYAMEVYDGKLIIGGQFSSFNGNPRRNLQAWDGTSTYDLGTAFGTGSQVRAMRVFEGSLFVGGNAPSDGHIARWDGTAWHSPGAAPSMVLAMTEWNGELVIGCSSGVVAKWNGTSWTPLGEPFNNSVMALEVHQGELYCGGVFTGSAGVVIHRLARWEGNEWAALASGVNMHVLTLKSDPLGLLVGGHFTHTYDSSSVLLRCARLVNGSLVPISNTTAYEAVQFFHRLPSGTLLMNNASVNGLWFAAGTRCVREYQGKTYAGGSNSYANGHDLIGGLSEVVDGRFAQELTVTKLKNVFSPTPGSFETYWEVPSPSQPNLLSAGGAIGVHTSAPWIRGEHQGSRYYSVPTYASIATATPLRPWAGPNAAVLDDAFHQRYYRVWRLDRAQVQEHIASWNAPGYSMPVDIRDWPGNGDTSNGEPALLAPFMDLDGDGVYEPELGEYPVFRGEQAIYSIQHTVTGGIEGPLLPVLPLDLHISAYAYGGVTDALDHTVFMNYLYVNRSDSTFENVRFGQFADFDISCAYDDMVGCDSTRSLFYATSSPQFDINCPDVLGYGPQPPAMGARFLSHALTSHRTLNRAPFEFQYQSVDDMLNGTSSGQAFTQPGYATNFMYPGGVWQDSSFVGQQYDQKSIGATGPFTLGPGDSLCFDVAFIYARATNGGGDASVEALKLRSDSVSAFYEAQDLVCSAHPVMTGIHEAQEQASLQLFPNPAAGSFTIVSSTPLEQVIITDLQGRVIHIQRTGADREVISTQGWATGVYLVRVSGTKGTRTARLLKQ